MENLTMGGVTDEMFQLGGPHERNIQIEQFIF